MESIHPTSNETNPPTPPTASPIFSGIVNFSGKSGEFFGIWSANILLSIITLRIYSA